MVLLRFPRAYTEKSLERETDACGSEHRLQRSGLGLITLFAVSVIIFASLQMLPGGYAQNILGQGATPETVAAFNRELGLDRSPFIRYVEWIGNLLQGDFGYSYSGLGGTIKRSVSAIIAPRLYNTFFLAVMAASIAVPLSLFLGILAALYRNSWFDRIINSVTLTTIAMPEFFIAYVLLCVLAVKFRWFFSLSTVGADTPFLGTPGTRGITCPDNDVRHCCLHDAYHTGRDYQPVGQSIHRNGAAEGCFKIPRGCPPCASQCLGTHCNYYCI